MCRVCVQFFAEQHPIKAFLELDKTKDITEEIIRELFDKEVLPGMWFLYFFVLVLVLTAMIGVCRPEAADMAASGVHGHFDLLGDVAGEAEQQARRLVSIFDAMICLH